MIKRIISSILLIFTLYSTYGLIFGDSTTTVPFAVFFMISIFFHCVTCFTTEHLNLSAFRIVKLDIFDVEDLKWNTKYYVEYQVIVQQSYLWIKKSKIDWVDDYESEESRRYLFADKYYVSEESAMQGIIQHVKKLKAKQLKETKINKIIVKTLNLDELLVTTELDSNVK